MVREFVEQIKLSLLNFLSNWNKFGETRLILVMNLLTRSLDLMTIVGNIIQIVHNQVNVKIWPRSIKTEIIKLIEMEIINF